MGGTGMSKRGILVSQGPSAVNVHRYAGRWHGATVVAVNSAVCRVDADYWVFCDAKTFADWHGAIVGSPLAVTRNLTPGKLSALWPLARTAFERWPKGPVLESLPACPVPRWYQWSGVAALRLLCYLGCDEIVCFGCDMAGQDDINGETGVSRNERRWEDERKVWAGICVEYNVRPRFHHGSGNDHTR